MNERWGALASAGAMGAFCVSVMVGAQLLTPATAAACGGFFCGQQPVDQQAEKILFAVDREANETTMIVEIQYQGEAPDFAWVVPLGDVPIADSLDTFPQAALTALDNNTAPSISGGFCFDSFGGADAGAVAFGASAPVPMEPPPVTIHIREEVGPYDVAVIESEDPDALVQWLRDNGFRITTAMEPYIAGYTSEGMKFLALKLRQEEDVSSIAPFRMTLPGSSPVIPLRMTALAAEPEMGIVAFVLGDQRYESANAPNLTIHNEDLVVDPFTGRSNWAAAVARAVDEAESIGWVTEMSGNTNGLVSQLENAAFATEEQEAAVDALLALMRARPYVTRMYTRLSPEEMTLDPVFRRSGGGDVSRFRTLPSRVDCGGEATDPCDFVTCGQGGTCALAEVDGRVVAGCACVPGATARTTTGPDGSAIATCIDQRMSFLNPGDVDVPGGTPLPDPCVGFDCGSGGSCVAMNMTPTCVCDEGLVAVGGFDAAGARTTACVPAMERVPETFYDNRLPARPMELPAGREVVVPEPTPRSSGGLCAVDGPGTEHGIPGALGFGIVLGLTLHRRRRN